MTFKDLQDIIKANNIPDDVKLMSDSKWEVDMTAVGTVYYNAKLNILVFKQPWQTNYSDDYKCIWKDDEI